MPRKARIDAAGALYHIIVRGIERRKIFYDDSDRDKFLGTIGRCIDRNGNPLFRMDFNSKPLVMWIST
jgi:hypothetical protein